MKRFFGFLLFTIIMAVIYFTIASAFVQPCNGAEPRITITYPPKVYSMTDTEFFLWATDQNNKARAEWDEWYKTAPPRWISYGVTDYQQSRRSSYFGSNSEQGSIRNWSRRDSYFGSNSEQGSVRHYEKRHLNPDYVSRPLTIINPYCRPRRQFSHTTGVWLYWDSFEAERKPHDYRYYPHQDACDGRRHPDSGHRQVDL